ncbi:MAG: inorganic diphosphatase [Deltaproteobacteria bacterium]|nr:inorganic diphosphatase [Deltaproteobacteria bacterium]
MPERALHRVTIPLFVALLANACASGGGQMPVAAGLSRDGPYAYKSKRNLLTNHMPKNADGTINAVIEIPAGTSEKWEVNEDGTRLVRDFTGENPRVIDYLPYPGNYGLIPRTLLSIEQGGDGGALDVMVIGPAVPRGTTVRARAIGVIRVVDRMEQDDKVLAVMEGPTLKDVFDIESLRRRYPGSDEILSLWWANAHGKRSKVNLIGTGSRGQAVSVIDYAAESWKNEQRKAREAQD